MIFDIDKGSEGEWFPFFESRINDKGEVVYDDPKPDAGKVCIRSISPIIEERQALRKKKYEFVVNTLTRQMERVGFYEDQAPEAAKQEREDIWDYAITGIENIFDKAGNPILCTRENKLKLMAIPAFDRFVARCLQLLVSAGAQAREDETKN